MHFQKSIILNTFVQTLHFFGQNSLGTCGDCGGQLFVNDDCTSAFFCMLPEELPEDAPADAEGCELVCEDDEILIADPRLNIYN